MTPTAFITHPDCWQHNMGAMHPESPDRLSAIRDQMIASGLDQYVDSVEAPIASRENLLLAHTDEYIDDIHAAVPERGITHLDPDTAMCPQTLKAALRAAGAGVKAVDLVMGGDVRSVFCAVRPPGHHAERMRAMGFCFFNNVAIAALHALEHHRLARVAVIDFDVHHGNGTEDILAGESRAMMLSFFQHPLYPYSGTKPLDDNMRNTPLPAGTRGDAVRALVEEKWLPALEMFQPEMLVISAGFDAHYEDDMASMALVEADYAWITARLREFADQHCKGRIVSMLEGGYALSALGRSVVAHVKALAGI
ncbi:histone deacetylase family protein [Uliginosibacterium sp. H1]|uniref:histone deacetylase family protein n=1 Tax=Uliginosibacterium sp. H1 TaxID=3114757 RepID=UPI002E178BAD|nr:histone deacetylase family protein [Uliginosibacterium sp. H1]